MEERNATSVYQYFDENGVVVYIGITSRNVRRQGEHDKGKAWWPFVASQSVEHFDTREQAHRREVELIRQYRPPFNVQHNPDHEVIRAAFLAYREAAAEHETPTDLVRASKKRIPLALVGEVDDILTFRTTPLFAPAAVRLVRPQTKVPVMWAGIAGGTVRAVEVEGTTAVIRCLKRRAMKVGRQPFARVAIINTRDGSGTQFHLKNIQACDDAEYKFLREDVA